jgi:hypothetical protein
VAYPRPAARQGQDLDYSIEPKFASGGEFYAENSESVEVTGAVPSWVLTSGARGMASCRLPLLGEGDQPTRYRVTLRFAELDSANAAKREFSIRLQGNPVAERFNVSKEAGGERKEAVVSIDNVLVNDDLLVEMQALGEQLPVLSAIEVERMGE